jgi:hypothetical protein
MDTENKPMLIGLVVTVVVLVVLVGVVAQRSLAPPKLTYPKGSGPAGPGAVARATGKAPAAPAMRRGPYSGMNGPGGYRPAGFGPGGAPGTVAPNGR